MIDVQQFLFRRQFVLGSKVFTPTDRWQSVKLGDGLILSAHPDLEVSVSRSEDRLLVLLGFWVDPLRPDADSSDILDGIAQRADRLTDVFDATESLTGRWAMIYQNHQQSVLFHDPFGLREIYYAHCPDGIWCGSQPEIIRANVPLEPSSDPHIHEYMNLPSYLSSEGAWCGAKTPYDNCFHLLPNHYLDLNTSRVERFFPEKELSPIDLDTGIETVATLLKGTVDALFRRRPLLFAVTAGWDSRTLLAAAREHLESITCYVDKKNVLPHNHPDVQVPLRLSRKLGFSFVVENSWRNPSREFLELLERNVTRARRLPKTRAIYAKFRRREGRTIVNGNGGEMGKSIANSEGEPYDEELSAEQIAAIFHYPAHRFIHDGVSAWHSGCRSLVPNALILNLFRWEQRMGNWGAHYPAEQDIAVEEVSPFNNRRMIITMLRVAAEFHGPHKRILHAGVIRHLWPEVLAEPINPPAPYSFRRDGIAAIRSFVRRSVPEPVVGLVKRTIRRSSKR